MNAIRLVDCISEVVPIGLGEKKLWDGTAGIVIWSVELFPEV